MAAACRSPSRFPIRGYEYYDYRGDVVNTLSSISRQRSRKRRASFLLFTSAGSVPESTISGAEFVNAKPSIFRNSIPGR